VLIANRIHSEPLLTKLYRSKLTKESEVKKKLNLLEELQGIDRAIDEQKAEQAKLNAEIMQLEQALASVQATIAEHQAQMAEFRHEKAELEVAMHTEQENIKRSETNMKEIRTNKEFQAVGREISAARKQVAELEELLLQLSIRSDELQATIDTCETEMAPLADSAQNGSKEKQAVIAKLQDAIDTVTAKREAIVKELSSNLVRRYTQLREQRRGQALAEARDGSCMGCNMQLPPQLYNMLFRGDEMYFCPHCQRILILKQEQAAE
jgi:predicted  nucleic acid-binding Zn-ribbon protein